VKYYKLEKYASVPRMERFFVATGSKSSAMNLYRVNLRVSQAFYPVLNLTEIFLRNSFYTCIEHHFSDSDWIITEKTGFMNDSCLAKSGYYLRNCVVNAENKMSKRGIAISSGKVLAEQSFGFWVSLFESAHYKLIGGSVIHSFPHKPPHINRKALLVLLSKIRDFRNRIYHNEPICFSGTNIDFTYVNQIKNDLFEMLGWIDPDIKRYVQQFDSIDSKINAYKI
jgi:hypothetical protein